MAYGSALYNLSFLDTFAHYPLARINEKWIGATATGLSQPNDLSEGLVITLAGTALLEHIFTTTGAGWTMGMRIKPTQISLGQAEIFRLSSGASRLVSLGWSSSGFLQWRKADGSVVVTDSVVQLSSAWTTIEVGFFWIDTTHSNVEVLVNGTRVISLTTSNFSVSPAGTIATTVVPGGAAAPDRISLRNVITTDDGFSISHVWMMRDTALWTDIGGTYPTGRPFIGTLAKNIRYATANGYHDAPGATQPTGGLTGLLNSNWRNGDSNPNFVSPGIEYITEALANGDGPGAGTVNSFVRNATAVAGTAVDFASWQFGSLPANASAVHMIQHCVEARCSPGAATGNINLFLAQKSVETTIAHAADIAAPGLSSSSYGIFRQPAVQNPLTSANWTVPLANDLSAGVRQRALS